MAETRPLPTLELPVAFLRFWPGGADLVETVDELPELVGVTRLGPRLLALFPVDGRGDIFDLAARLAGALLVRRAKSSPSSKLPGVLIFPGQVRFAQRAEPVVDTLFEDLDNQGPRLPAGKIVLTSYVAAWLRGRYEVSDAGVYEAPSGNRVPFFELGAERSMPEPWHNPEILGRRARIPRPQVDQDLAQVLERTPCRITGPLGVGKTRSVAAALPTGEGLKIWVGLGRALPSLPLLARTVARELQQHLPNSNIDPARLAGADNDSRADLLVSWLALVENRLGNAPFLICDVAEAANDGDLQLLDRLLARPRFHEVCRLVVIERSGNSRLATLDAAEAFDTVSIPAFSAAEIEALSGDLLNGLELLPAVRERFLAATNGHPFALEEGLLRLVHRGLVRRVYGSFFYAGGDDVTYEPSERLVRHVEAEVHRLGDPLPLRILAAAEEPISPNHLRTACEELGLELPIGWQRDYEEAGWLKQDNDGALSFLCPAYGKALATTVSTDGLRSLRRALGGVLAESGPGAGWTAYRLMAGSPDALPSLLDFTRDSKDGASREEVFNALWQEYRDHRDRNGDEPTELEILWALLPLARRLGCLGQLDRELRRGIELARSHEQRYVALVALAAELDQERGNFRDAERGLREALSASEGFDQSRRATLFVRLGALLHREERWREAEDIFRNLLEVVEGGEETSFGATCLFYLGNIALQQRRLDEAESLHRKAEVVRREKGSNRPLGISLSALGSVALARGDYPTALNRFRNALDLLPEGNDSWDRSFVLLGKGKALGQLGDITAAAAVLRQGLEARLGREDRLGEAIARLEVAENFLQLDQLAQALDETRRAHFHLSLIPEVSCLGDAERLLGRVFLRQSELEEGRRHLEEALRIHSKHDDSHALAEDHSWMLEIALRTGEWELLLQQALALDEMLDGLRYPSGAEYLAFRLYRAFDWLAKNGFESRDPIIYLRRSYRELMRKTGFLEPAHRHHFVYQIREHQAILDAASVHQISLPIFTVTPSG